MTRDLWVPDKIKEFNPQANLGKYLKTILHLLPYEQACELIDRYVECLIVESALYGRVHDRYGLLKEDTWLCSRKVVTTAGVNAIVDAFQNSIELENFKYHGVGTGSSAETIAQTGLVTELTTQYSTNNTRPTGTTAEGSSANIYQSVATITVDATVSLAEHGLFNNATVGSGVLLDRSLITPVVDLESAESFTATYELLFAAGG